MLSSSALCMCYGVTPMAVSPLDPSPSISSSRTSGTSSDGSIDSQHQRVYHSDQPRNDTTQHVATTGHLVNSNNSSSTGRSSLSDAEETTTSTSTSLPQLRAFLSMQLSDTAALAFAYVALVQLLSLPASMSTWTTRDISTWIAEVPFDAHNRVAADASRRYAQVIESELIDGAIFQEMLGRDLEDLGFTFGDAAFVVMCRDLYLQYYNQDYHHTSTTTSISTSTSTVWGSSDSLSEQGITPLTALSAASSSSYSMMQPCSNIGNSHILPPPPTASYTAASSASTTSHHHHRPDHCIISTSNASIASSSSTSTTSTSTSSTTTITIAGAPLATLTSPSSSSPWEEAAKHKREGSSSSSHDTYSPRTSTNTGTSTSTSSDSSTFITTATTAPDIAKTAAVADMKSADYMSGVADSSSTSTRSTSNRGGNCVYGQLILLGRLDKGCDDDSRLPPSVFAAQASRFVLTQKDIVPATRSCGVASCTAMDVSNHGNSNHNNYYCNSTSTSNCISTGNVYEEGDGVDEWSGHRGKDSPKRMRLNRDSGTCPSGLACRHCDCDYIRVQAYDTFQFGRDACAVNDFVVSPSPQSSSLDATMPYRPLSSNGMGGANTNWTAYRQQGGANPAFQHQLHHNSTSSSSTNGGISTSSYNTTTYGPTVAAISKHAFRIEVERQFPHRAFILASGFDQNKNMYLPKNSTYLPSEDDACIDLDEDSRVVVPPPPSHSSNSSNSSLFASILMRSSSTSTSSTSAATSPSLSSSLSSASALAVPSHNNKSKGGSRGCKGAQGGRRGIGCSNGSSNTRTNCNSSSSSRLETDALTALGVRLWSPVHRDWVEVSVQGQIFEPRTGPQQPGRRRPDRTNEIVSGSIIDIGGAYLLFQHQKDAQSNSSSSAGPAPSAAAIIASINSKRPQCPVLMRSLQLEYYSTRDRLLQSLSQSLCQECRHGSCNLLGKHHQHLGGGGVLNSSSSTSSINRIISNQALAITTTSLSKQFEGVYYGDTSNSTNSTSAEDEAVLPYVYTACGHVHSYSKELAGRPCPMCRASGDFVPLRAAFLAPICLDAPTHVFNPCGHAASEEACRLWSSFPLVKTHFNHETSRRPACPFCLRILIQDARFGGPYNRLVFQFDS